MNKTSVTPKSLFRGRQTAFNGLILKDQKQTGSLIAGLHKS